jgi:hypothetical protein
MDNVRYKASITFRKRGRGICEKKINEFDTSSRNKYIGDLHRCIKVGQDSSVSIMSDYRLDNRDLMPGKGRAFFF